MALAYYAYGEWEIRQGYHTETVRFDNQGVHLVGTLYLPEKTGKNPGMIILSGSAATGRSLNRSNAVPFVRKGIAVLVYDRRGIGDSSGNRNAINFTAPPRDMEPGAGDAAAALEYLRSRPDMRPESIGFMGISEGGWIAPRAAAISGHAAFLLNISASPATFYSIVLHQGGYASLELFKRKSQKDFDPMTSLRALDVPSLWVQAGEDTLVPNDAAIALLQSLQRQGKPVEYRVIPGAWHGLFVAPVKPVWETIDPWMARVTEEKRR
ncbi:MAG: prolyl oligopeptidase family serine peptidase [Novosphingobium sp.]